MSLRVLICSDLPPETGSGARAREIGDALASRGHLVQFATPNHVIHVSVRSKPDVVIGQYGGAGPGRRAAASAGAAFVLLDVGASSTGERSKAALVVFAHEGIREQSAMPTDRSVAASCGLDAVCEAIERVAASRGTVERTAAVRKAVDRVDAVRKTIQHVSAARAATPPAPIPPPAPTGTLDVSVVMPAYNAKKFLEAAARSVLDQHDIALELIIVDDGSADGTMALAESLSSQNPRVRVASSGRRGGGAAGAKNAGYALSRAPYVTFFDADDVMLPGSLAPRVEALRNNPAAVASFGRLEGLIDAAGAPIESSYIPHVRALDGINRRRGGFSQSELGNGACIAGYTSLVYPRAILARLEGPFDVSLRSAEDFDMAYRVSGMGRILFVDVGCLLYRIHGKNTSCVIAPTGTLHPRAENAADHRRVLAKHGIQ